MSELKEHLFCECDECIREYRGPLSNEMRPYYLKTEADKVIAHNKYKRCLAMAKWCESEAYIHEHGSDYDEDLVAWFGKWYKRWLKLAEKFKEEK